MTQVAFWRDPTVPYLVDARDTHLASDPFRLHTHDSCMVSCIEAGSTLVQLRDRALTVQAGAVVIILPGEPHACNPQPQEAIAYKSLFLHPDWLGSLGVRQRACVIEDAALKDIFISTYSMLREPGDRLAKDEAYYDLVAALEAAMESAPATAAPPSATPLPQSLDAVQRYLVAHMTRMVTLDELAHLAGLGPHQVLRRFRSHVGLSPHAWQMQRRVEQAKTLLAQGMSVVDVALETGFADQSHFHRVFKRHVGATPGQYQGVADGNRNIVQS